MDRQSEIHSTSSPASSTTSPHTASSHAVVNNSSRTQVANPPTNRTVANGELQPPQTFPSLNHPNDSILRRGGNSHHSAIMTNHRIGSEQYHSHQGPHPHRPIHGNLASASLTHTNAPHTNQNGLLQPMHPSSRAALSHRASAWDAPAPVIAGPVGKNMAPPSPHQEQPHRIQGAASNAGTLIRSATQPPHFQSRRPSAQPYTGPPAFVPMNPLRAQHGQQQTSYQKPKVVLSQEAKAALAKAIWSAIRSPEGSIAPDLMQAALATGLPKNAILNAARVAREREAMKRKSMQHPSVPPSQQQPPPSSSTVSRHPQSAYSQAPSVPSAVPHVMHHSTPAINSSNPQPSRAVLNNSPVPPSLNAAPTLQPASRPQNPLKPKATQSLHQFQQVQHFQVKADERDKWQRLHHGVFVVQKGKFLAPPHTVGAIVCVPDAKSLIAADAPLSSHRKRDRKALLTSASALQRTLLAFHEEKAPIALLDPEKFKRVKIEAKKHAKAVDRVVRKARQTVAESLNKQHKELSKAIASHQQEFFKFHKQKRADALKVARLIRDTFDKESKKKEKDAVSAERARLAALKANDMDAYSKLLEETKNDRLKFLMDKTEKHFSQISSSLLEARNQDGTVVASGGTASYYASAHLKTEDVRQPSILVGGALKEYQMAGLQWLLSLYNNKLNGILADEMGLGKTIQAISLVSYLMEFKSNLGPYLVIVPLSTLSNWVNEFQKWCPSAHVICYKGTPGQRKEIYKDQVKNGHFNVLLTTYEYIIKDKASLRKLTWQYAIVDEGHRMKNASSKFARTLATQYTTRYRLLLTGTPLMNDLSELWALLNFLLPSIFNSVEAFDEWFNRPFAQFGGSSEHGETNMLSNEERMFIIHRLHELLRPFMLRRVKSEVLDQLPEKVEKVLRCELSSWQKELYKQISMKAVAENSTVGNGFSQATNASRGLNNVVMQLRKVCNHPYLFSPLGYEINQDIIRSSGKLELLDKILPKFRAAGHRVLMFTQMTAVMTILEDYFAYRGFLSLRLDGSTPAEEREKRMYKFNAPDSPYFIFLLSTRAGGLGLNLTAANTVIIFDSDWNPMMDLQAQDRAHRIGQRSDVSVFRLVTCSPVEEKILSRATEKLNMSELVVEAGKFDKSSVENDNSLERKKMMEVLLTDFDTNTAKNTIDEKTVSSDGGDDDMDEDDNGSDESKDEDLNDLISNNEDDYQLYKAIDEEIANDPCTADVSLFTNEDDIPDWVRYPGGRKLATEGSNTGNGPRKRKEVMYDDGLTEKQFLRMMDKQFDADASAKDQMKQGNKLSTSSISAPTPSQKPGNDMTDWTFRKLISCTKAVIALKDPSTKRRFSEIFLEKPSPEQFPDYYELIEKPIAINDILRKCRAKIYTNLEEFRNDWNLMFLNARTFNGDGSWVVQNGTALEKELERVLKKNGFGDVTPKKPPPPKKAKLRIKLSLKTLRDKDMSSQGDTEPVPTARHSENESIGDPVDRKKRKIK